MPNETTPLSRPVESAVTTNVPPPVASTPPANLPPKRRGRLLKVIFVLILLGAVGAFGYLWWHGRTQLSEAQATKVAAEKTASDKDATIASLKDQLGKTSASPTPAPASDADQVKVAAKNYIEANVSIKAGSYTLATPSFSTKDKNFAKIGYGVNGETGGSALVLKKVNSSWTIIVTGLQNSPSTEDVVRFGIPSDIK